MTQPVDNQVVWFDIPVRDLDRAIRFYSAVLAAPLDREAAGPRPGSRRAAARAEHRGRLPRAEDRRRAGAPGPLVYLNAKGRLDDAIAAAEKHGGKVLEPKHSIAPHGFRAVVLDSEGNRIRCTRCKSRQLHHLQRRAADEAGGVGEGGDQLEVVEPFADEVSSRRPTASSAAANSRDWRWNSGLS